MSSVESVETLRDADGGHARFTKSLILPLIILGAQYFLGFITSPLIARVLGPTDRGRLTFFLSISQWAVVILGLGSPQAITYLVASRRFTRSQSVNVVFTVLLSVSAAAGALAFALFSLWSPALSYLTPTEIALLAVFSFASFSLALLSALLLGLQKIIDYYISQLLTPLLFFGVLITLLLTGRFAYLPLLQSYTAIIVLTCIVVAVHVIRQIGFELSFPFKAWRPILTYGLKLYPGSILSIAIVRLDVLFVAMFLGFTELGYYAISVQMAEVVYQLASVFATIRLPQTASGSKADADRSFPSISRQLILTSLLCALLIAAGGILLIRLWLPNFKPSIAALLLLLPGTISLGLAHLYFAELCGRGRPGYGTMIIIINTLMMILLDLWLIPAWGINGAAIASSVVYTMGFAFALFAVHKESGVGFRDLILIGPQDLSIYKTLLRDLKVSIQNSGSGK
jgi:O-antigen/teichoic acid export membrane protein